MQKAAVAVVLLLALGCAQQEKAPPKPLSEPGETLYTVRGIVMSRDAADNTLRVDHEEIPGYMEAMVMDYPVRGAEVASLPPDKSRIEAKLHVRDSRIWITDVKRIP
jgi:protein SCO1